MLITPTNSNISIWLTKEDFVKTGTNYVATAKVTSLLGMFRNVKISNTFKLLVKIQFQYNTGDILLNNGYEGSYSFDTERIYFDTVIFTTTESELNKIPEHAAANIFICDINLLFDNQIILYNNKRQDNYVNKNLYEIKTISGNFRDDINIISPIFTFESKSVPDFNYVYINNFGRYYFVDNIVCNRNYIYTVYCSCDVLMSFQNPILNLNCYVIRQEVKKNKFIVDNELPVSSKIQSEKIIAKDSKLSVAYQLPDDCNTVLNNENEMRIAVTVFSYLPGFRGLKSVTYIQPNSSGQCCTYFLRIKDYYTLTSYLSQNDLSAVFAQLFGKSADAIIDISILPFDMEKLCKKIYPSSNDLGTYGYIESDVMHLNTALTTGAAGISIKCYLANNPYEYVITAGVIELPILNSWKDLNNAVSAKLYIPFYGFVDLDLDYIYSTGYHRIAIMYNYRNFGNSLVSIYTVEDDDMIVDRIDTFECKLGVQVPFGSSNLSDITREMIFAGINIALKTAFGVASLSVDKPPEPKYTPVRHQPTKKYLRQLQSYEEQQTKSKISIANQASLQLVGTQNIKHELNINSRADNTYNYFALGGRAWVIITKPTFEEPTNYHRFIGYPSNAYGILREFRGYTKVGGCYITNMPGATKEEVDEINEIIRSGIIIG